MRGKKSSHFKSTNILHLTRQGQNVNTNGISRSLGIGNPCTPPQKKKKEKKDPTPHPTTD